MASLKVYCFLFWKSRGKETSLVVVDLISRSIFSTASRFLVYILREDFGITVLAVTEVVRRTCCWFDAVVASCGFSWPLCSFNEVDVCGFVLFLSFSSFNCLLSSKGSSSYSSSMLSGILSWSLTITIFLIAVESRAFSQAIKLWLNWPLIREVGEVVSLNTIEQVIDNTLLHLQPLNRRVVHD